MKINLRKPGSVVNNPTCNLPRSLELVLVLYLFSWTSFPLAAQTHEKLNNHLELELNLNRHYLSFSGDLRGDWLGVDLDASGVQLGITIPIAPNSALVGQFELQKQYNLGADYYCDIDCYRTIYARSMDENYLVKPFFGVGIRHHFMSTGLWIQAMYLTTYAPFYSGTAKNGYRSGSYYGSSFEPDYYTFTTFSSNFSVQQFGRFSLGYQLRPFKQSGMGFGVGAHTTFGKNSHFFDYVENKENGYSKGGQERVIIAQKAISFSVSFFVPMNELKKRN